MTKFPNVFGEGAGQFSGEYRIKVDESVPPVQHAPHRVAIAFRPKLKEALDDLEAPGIKAAVATHTQWISFLVAVPKKTRKLHICLDPKDLDRKIQREHYQLPAVEDVSARLHGAKVFTLMDIKSGFWHM